MPKIPEPVAVDIRIADLPQVQAFLASVTVLLAELSACDLPMPAVAAVHRLRRDAEALAGRHIGPPPESAADLIRRAQAEAQHHPGRIGRA